MNYLFMCPRALCKNGVAKREQRRIFVLLFFIMVFLCICWPRGEGGRANMGGI